jgi:hypothetical protein
MLVQTSIARDVLRKHILKEDESSPEETMDSLLEKELEKSMNRLRTYLQELYSKIQKEQ